MIGIFNNRSLICNDFSWTRREITDGVLSSGVSALLFFASLVTLLWYY